jgi:hypothetical protein
MQLSAHYTLTRAEALRGNRTFKRRWYGVSVGSGLLLVLLGLSGAWLAPGQRAMGVFLAFDGLVFAAMPEMVLRWALLKRGALPQAPVEAAFDDEGLWIRSGGAEGRLGWNAFNAIHRRGGFWIFRLAANRAVLVPERALGAAGNEALAAFLRDRKRLKE